MAAFVAMVEFGFEQKSFQGTSSRFIFIFLFLTFLGVCGLALSPDLAGLLPRPFNKELLVDFIDVGQGDSILLRTPLGRAFLIDGGTSETSSQAKSEGRELVQSFLQREGVTQLDGLVITNPHNDHLGGIIPVLKLLKVSQIWDCGDELETDIYKDFVSLCKQKRIPHTAVKSGDQLDWGEELFVQVLHPPEVSKSQEFSAVNNMSVTLLVRYGKVSLLFPGDIEEPAEKELTRYGKNLKCQVIKVPHHGSDTSIYGPFLNLVAPDCGVIQVGRDNAFKHPSPPMLDLYSRMGTKVYRTDRQGNIRLTVGGHEPRDFSFRVDRDL